MKRKFSYYGLMKIAQMGTYFNGSDPSQAPGLGSVGTVSPPSVFDKGVSPSKVDKAVTESSPAAFYGVTAGPPALAAAALAAHTAPVWGPPAMKGISIGGHLAGEGLKLWWSNGGNLIAEGVANGEPALVAAGHAYNAATKLLPIAAWAKRRGIARRINQAGDWLDTVKDKAVNRVSRVFSRHSGKD